MKKIIYMKHRETGERKIIEFDVKGSRNTTGLRIDNPISEIAKLLYDKEWDYTGSSTKEK